MTTRRACALAFNLPQGALTWQAVGSDNAWTDETHLLASMFDALNIANWQRSGDKNSAMPKPIVRPSGIAELDEKRTRMIDQARRFKERTTTRAEARDGN